MWGGISARGTTELIFFPGTVRMDSKFYCRILNAAFIPFSKKEYNGFARLVQDNAPAHKSAYTTTLLQQWEIATVDWPPESPDLNPIELVWGNMKNYIRLCPISTIPLLRSTSTEKCSSTGSGSPD